MLLLRDIADVYVQLLESSISVCLLGLSTAVSGTPQLLLTDSALSSLHDQVLLPPGQPGLLLEVWRASSKSSNVKPEAWAPGVLLSGGVVGAAEKGLLRALRLCAHLAQTNWQVWAMSEQAVPAAAAQPQQQQDGKDSSSAAGHTGSTAADQTADGTGDPAAAGQAGAAAAGAGAVPSGSSSSAAPATTPDRDVAAPAAGSSPQGKGMQQLPVPLVFSEWVVTVASQCLTVEAQEKPVQQRTADACAVLYTPHAQAQLQQDTGAASLGAATAALMPVLAARVGLMLCCLVADLAVLQTFAAGGVGLFRGGLSSQTNQTLLVLSLKVAKQVLELAVDLAKAQHRRDAAVAAAAAAASAGSAEAEAGAGAVGANPKQEPKQQPHQHWLTPGLRAALKAVNSLLPGSTGSSGSKGKGKSSSSNSMPLGRFSEALLALSEPLGVRLVQLSTEPGAAGGIDKGFRGIASKNRAPSAQEKVLAATTIVVTQVGKPAALVMIGNGSGCAGVVTRHVCLTHSVQPCLC